MIQTTTTTDPKTGASLTTGKCVLDGLPSSVCASMLCRHAVAAVASCCEAMLLMYQSGAVELRGKPGSLHEAAFDAIADASPEEQRDAVYGSFLAMVSELVMAGEGLGEMSIAAELLDKDAKLDQDTLMPKLKDLYEQFKQDQADGKDHHSADRA